MNAIREAQHLWFQEHLEVEREAREKGWRDIEERARLKQMALIKAVIERDSGHKSQGDDE